MTQRRKSNSMRDRGVSAIEFALVIPVVILLVLGSIEIGLAFQERELVGNAAREGARAASLGGSDAQISAAATAALGDATGATVTAACSTLDGLTCSPGTPGGMVTVTVSVAYTGATGVIPALTNTRVSASNTMRIEG